MRKHLKYLAAMLTLAAFTIAAWAMNDALLSSNVALSANATTPVYTTGIDLGSTAPSLWNKALLRLDVPAMSDHATAATNIAFTLIHSADDTDYTNTFPIVQAVLYGKVTSGTSATNYYFQIPKNVKRYVKIKAVITGGIVNSSSYYITNSLVVP